MTRLCSVCKRDKTLDQFDLARYTSRCLKCSESWGPARVKLRILLRDLGSVGAVARAIGYAESTTRKYLRQPETITPRASRRIREAS